MGVAHGYTLAGEVSREEEEAKSAEGVLRDEGRMAWDLAHGCTWRLRTTEGGRVGGGTC